MTTLTGLLALGVFVSVPCLGALLWPGAARVEDDSLGRFLLRCAAGAAAWSPALLLTAENGLFSPLWNGAAGWALVLVHLLRGWRADRWSRPTLGRSALFTALTLLAVTVLNAAFPGEYLIGGRDMGIYTSTAVRIARTGQVKVPYPYTPADAAELSPLFDAGDEGRLAFPGLHPEAEDLLPQFGHLYPAWLGQAYGTGGLRGLFAFNALASLLGALALFVLARWFVPAPLAAGAALFLALNPAGLWLARTPLTEPLSQFFTLSGLLVLCAGLRSGTLAPFFWAGFVLGAAALLRQASLALFPLALSAVALLRLPGLARPGAPTARALWVFASSGLCAGLLALTTYWVYARAYLLDTRWAVILAGLAAGAALAGAGASGWDGLRPIGSALRSRKALWSFSALVAAGFFFFLFLRPRWGPFPVWDWPGHPLDGLRTHAEDTLPNLAAYLSPAVLGLALLGAVALARRAREDADRGQGLLLLTVVLPMSAMILYKPTIEPSHIWAVRRFAPLVIPGLLVLAAAGLWALLARCAPPVRRWAGALCAALALAFLASASAPFLARPECPDLAARVEDLAASVPPGEYLFSLTPDSWRPWETPLLVGYSVPVLPVDRDRPETVEAFHRWVRRETAAGRQVLAAAAGDRLPSGIKGSPFGGTDIPFERLAPTLAPPPREWVDQEIPVRLYRITGCGAADAVLGGEDLRYLPGGREEGVWAPEYRPWRVPVRWTQARATLEIPWEEPSPPRALQLYLSCGNPEGTRIQVLVGGTEVARSHLPPGPGFLQVPIAPGACAGGRFDLELRCEPWRPCDVTPGATDTRRLGVALEGVRLLRRDFPESGGALPPEGVGVGIALRRGDPARLSCAADAPAALRLWLQNHGQGYWPTTRERGTTAGSVRLGARWYRGQETLPVGESRCDPPWGPSPGDGLPVTFLLRPVDRAGSPLPPGIYRVRVGLLQEGVQWFPSGGDAGVEVEVVVGP